MHTLGKNGNGTWWVGRCESSTVVLLLFDNMPFAHALTLCNHLNGGSLDINPDAVLRYAT